MKRCTIQRVCSSTAAGLGRQSRRCISHDKDSLSKQRLLDELEAGLGEDTDGQRLKIDADSREISTAAGSLPISPIFDPAWIQARRRQKKDDPTAPSGRFRKKLANNPFARALATPPRKCSNTGKILPRYFLQDFELVKHPETGAAWWAPGPLALEFVQPKKWTEKPADVMENGAEDKAATNATESMPPVETNKAPSDAKAAVATAKNAVDDTTTTLKPSPARSIEDGEAQGYRPRRGPITSYVLGQKYMLDGFGGSKFRQGNVLLAGRTGMSSYLDSQRPVWRSDMADVLLQLLRREAVDALITRGNRTREPKDKFIQACTNWESIKNVKLRGCVLWLPRKNEDDGGVGQFATLDVEGVQYGRKMAVHNLLWLFGEEEVARLRKTTAMFRENEVLVLKQWNNVSMMRLHMLLWRLQGYLAAPPT